MATPAAPPEERTPGGTNPVLIVAATLLTVVLATFVIYSIGDPQGQDALAGEGTANLANPASAAACGRGAPDDSYEVDLVANPNPPRPEGTNFVLTVRNDGRPVTGAKVCLKSDMPDMQHPGLTSIAKESPGGRYEVRIQFSMGGSWETSVVIAEPDKPAVSVPLTIEVAQVEPG